MKQRKPLSKPALDTQTVTATLAKNEFGRLLEQVIRGGRVVITRYDLPKAVLLSMDDYHALTTHATRELATLSAEFDRMLERMQTEKARAGMQAAFDASPDQLAAAAVRSARKRR